MTTTPAQDYCSITIAAKPKSGAALVLFISEKEPLADSRMWRFLDRAEKNYLSSPAVAHAIKSIKAFEAKTFLMPGSGRTVIVVNFGRRHGKGADLTMTPKTIALAYRTAVRTAERERIERFACEAPHASAPSATRDRNEIAASNAVMAAYSYAEYKTFRADAPRHVKEVQFVVPADAPRGDADAIREGVRRGQVIGEETNACRTLQNTPGGDMTPEVLARHAIDVAKKVGAKATVLGVAEMKRLGMGGVLGVGQGSSSAPKFIVIEYMAGPKGEAPIVLVGKGVTFDTGGLNLKSSEHIYEMHMDMSGGAAVIHSLAAAARLGVKKNIVALVPAVENMPSGSSYRPGDLLRTMNGKTIEVLDTDAEGRVILSDALEYAQKYAPSLVVDVATLTGAAMRALGWRYAALFAPDSALEARFRALGDAVADPLWPLPINEDFEADVKGTFADWANVGKPGSAGATNGAVFLWQFTKDAKGTPCYPWVHLDIAPRMTATEEEHLAKGALGTPVRLLARLLEE